MKDRPSPVVEMVEVSTNHKKWYSGRYYFNIYSTNEEMLGVPVEDVIEINKRLTVLLNRINREGDES